MLLAPPRRIVARDFELRAWSVRDLALLSEALIASEEHLRPWTPWVIDGRVPGLSLEERLARHEADFARGAEWVYGLFTRSDEEVLGAAGLHPRIGPNAVELGYWLAAGRTGRGLATRAAELLTRVAFDAPGIDHVEIRCERRNVASARVPQRLGYRLVDAAPGTPEDLMIWRLTRTEFAERTPNDALWSPVE
jgi:RimJ/RimL family protein N-acetyltransferase